MTSATPSILVLVLCLAVLAPLAFLGFRQSRRAAAASDESVGSNFLAGMAFLFAFLASPIGILFSHLSLRQITRTGASGVRLAIAGFYISYALTVVQLVVLFAISVPR
ncbi:DUF4190 domain-containing protein [Subtercola boreus]|uniref:DUF4190 domain-containing protein n=1 Tax=Subtercola boreus TaxID=120213 RepID=A0A3E0WFV0_9MICO|nr:DUF4190 domain-containing protein [Subtercola boreus]RFA22716.1 hypothetical protein B7R24_03670 [Subtercola boreus]RFA23071.1 hypothetical protein B7R23_03665 [Subtercola boreus]RFA28824.1 hypothetical protein B7R25_03680 [Subtercola boreus]